ncbi:MAG: heterodisulfide reductase-related iron-sulfur binding cluster [Conexivisphaera sp.]
MIPWQLPMVAVPEIKYYLFVQDLYPLIAIESAVAAAICAYGSYRAASRWLMGQPLPVPDRLGARLANVARYTFAQVKVWRRRLPGVLHSLIFWGTAILLIGTILDAVESELTLRFLGARFLIGPTYLWFKLAMNVGGIMLIAGILLAYYRRLRGLTPNLPTGPMEHYMLLSLLAIAVTGFFLDSVNTYAYRVAYMFPYDPVGYSLALLYRDAGLTVAQLVPAYRAVWLFHMTLAIMSIGFIPYTKFSHIFVHGALNVLYYRLDPPAAFRPVEDLQGRVERGEVVGATRASELTWKERLDLDACVKCARCTNACPAFASGKPLSPMSLVQSLREAVRSGPSAALVSEGPLAPEVYWSCTTCGACVSECPTMIHHVEIIIDVRRGMVSAGGAVPERLSQALYNIMRLGNPFGFDPDERVRWMERVSGELGIPFAEPGEEYDYVYWVGCNTAFDPNLRPVAESLLRLLKRAGLRVALLREETCCGEPARRIGDEYLFAENAKSVGEILSKYKFGSLLVSCPHGYNNFRHEMPLYGVKFEVVHHAQLLSRLVREGRLRPADAAGVRVTFHDPCYLARWNGVVEDPRFLIRSTGAELVEMARHGADSFCCGGGGAQFFFDIKIGERVSRIRASQAAQTGARRVVVACPFCNAMFRSEAQAFGLDVVDLAQLLEGG